MITRTIKTSNVDVMTANTTKGAIENVKLFINKEFHNNNEIEKYIKKFNLLGSEHVFVRIDFVEVTEEKYGISEEDFMKYAVKLEK